MSAQASLFALLRHARVEDDDEFLLLCALLTTLRLRLGSGRGSIVSPVTDQNEFVLLTHTKSVNSTSRNVCPLLIFSHVSL